ECHRIERELGAEEHERHRRDDYERQRDGYHHNRDENHPPTSDGRVAPVGTEIGRGPPLNSVQIRLSTAKALLRRHRRGRGYPLGEGEGDESEQSSEENVGDLSCIVKDDDGRETENERQR